METPGDTNPIEDELLQHGGFLRRLARSLVGDEHESEDLVQGAWTAALADRPRAGSLRAWLATVVRHAASNLHRDRSRRQDRERVAARPELALPDPTIDAQLELQSRVVVAVRELREPYRTAIHLRYFRDLSPTAIAKKEGISVRTVETRLARGRSMLRDALTRASGGDSRRWMSVLLPLSCPPIPPAAPLPFSGSEPVTAGAFAGPTLGALVGMKLWITAAVSVTAVAVTLWISSDASSSIHPPGSVEQVSPRAPAALVDVAPIANEIEPEVPSAPEAARSVVERGERSAPAEVAPVVEAVAARTFRGRVVDADGLALAAVGVSFEGGESGARLATTSDVQGRFEFEVETSGDVGVDEDGLVTVLRAKYDAHAPEGEGVVIAAEARELEVRVVDEQGDPLTGALVEVAPPDEFASRFQLVLESSAPRTQRGWTDERGIAHFEGVPALEGLKLEATLDGYATQERELVAVDLVRDRLEQTFTLVHLSSVAQNLRGVVLDAVGDPIPDAAVSVGLLSTTTGPDGRFFFDLAGEEPFPDYYHGHEGGRFEVMAVEAGFLPGVHRPQLDEDGEPLWPSEIVLRLTDPCRGLEGRVVDLEGIPLPGYTVFLTEARLFGMRTLEGLLAGGGESWSPVRATTDDDGWFELYGLLDQDYSIAALDPGTLLRSETVIAAAGRDDVVLRVDTDDSWRKVTGRVVDRHGIPIAGAVLQPNVRTQTARGAMGIWGSSEELDPETTDADGAFTFRELSRAAALSVRSPDVIHRSFEPEELQLAGDVSDRRLSAVTLQVARRLRLQVLLSDPEEADELLVLDAEDSALDLHSQDANSYLIRSDNGVILEGRSRHLFVTDTAATLVLKKAGAEVRRIPIALEPGGENVLEL